MWCVRRCKVAQELRASVCTYFQNECSPTAPSFTGFLELLLLTTRKGELRSRADTGQKWIHMAKWPQMGKAHKWERRGAIQGTHGHKWARRGHRWAGRGATDGQGEGLQMGKARGCTGHKWARRGATSYLTSASSLFFLSSEVSRFLVAGAGAFVFSRPSRCLTIVVHAQRIESRPFGDLFDAHELGLCAGQAEEGGGGVVHVHSPES